MEGETASLLKGINKPISRRSFTAFTMATGAISFDEAANASRPGRRKMSVEDRLDLIELLDLYAWNYDCGNAAGTAATFTADGVVEVSGEEKARGREAIQRLIKTFYDTVRKDNSWQHVTNHPILDGGRSFCTMYSYWAIVQRNIQGKNDVMTFGYYRAECVKKDGGWLISKLGINQWDRDKLPWA